MSRFPFYPFLSRRFRGMGTSPAPRRRHRRHAPGSVACEAGPCARQTAAPRPAPHHGRRGHPGTALSGVVPCALPRVPGRCRQVLRVAARLCVLVPHPHLRRPRLLLPVFSARVHARVCVCAVHVCSLRLFTYESASVSSDRFLTACAISAPSICLSDGTSSAVASGRPRGRRPRLASDLRGEALGLNACDVSGRVFVGGLYRVKKASFSSCFECWCLVVKGCWISSDAFSVSVEIIM